MTKGRLGIMMMAAAAVVIGTGTYFLGGARLAAVPFRALMGQIGITVGVAPNPYNTLNDQLNAKQAQIDMENADLAAREAEFASETASSAPLAASSPVLWYLVIAIGVLALLVGLNFYLDWRRGERERILEEPRV